MVYIGLKINLAHVAVRFFVCVCVCVCVLVTTLASTKNALKAKVRYQQKHLTQGTN